MRDDLPTGWVTLLFTDIEGSTRLLHEVGPARYAEALATHRRLLRAAFARHGGVEVDAEGDAFFVAFSDPGAAVAAASEAQAALGAGPIRVRMGLHAGQPHATEHGYVGEDVHLGARIGAAGHGGQVLLSRQTVERVGRSIDVVDLGEHRLKDFPAPVWIYQLGDGRFPPLKTISNTNLPRPGSSFVGREREIAELRSLITDGARMATLTGPGGTGKTRLAIEAAAELVAEFRNGVFWVDLSTVRGRDHVMDAIAHAIGAPGGVAEHIAERQMLLVLDNLEQVADVAPELAELVAACPGLRLLGTSREVLRVSGEVEYRVTTLSSAEAVQLFSVRAGDASDEAVVGELCARLDNLPLAVELAAARASVLSPRQILERIGQRLDLLRAGRGADPRQQTLRATIEWSHDLLSDDEKALFARLSVFAGGWTLASAEIVCDAGLDPLQSLVDKSLASFADERFAMLESVRHFAAERLEASGESPAIRRRHAEHFVSLAEEAEPHILGPHPVEWLDRLEREHGNIRAALEWLDAAGETQLGLRLGGALWEFWCLRAHYSEGVRRLAKILDSDARRTLARAKALTGATHLAGHQSMEQRAIWADEAVELYAELGDAWGTAYAEYQKAQLHTDRGDFASAAPLLEQSVSRLRAVGDEHRALLAMRALAWCHEELGERGKQKELTEEILERARATNDRLVEARALAVLAGIASDEGLSSEALAMIEQAYRIDQQVGDPDEINIDLARFARILAAAGRPRAAVKLVSLRHATRPDPESADVPWAVKMDQQALDAARAALDEDTFAEAWAEGSKASIDDAVNEGLAEPLIDTASGR